MAAAPSSAVRRWVDRARIVAIDWALLAIAWMMAEFLVLAFSGRRGPTGMLFTAEQIIDLVHYGVAITGGLVLAAAWSLVERVLGASPGRALSGSVPADEVELPWTQTLRGWFAAVFIELTFFTGWLITELELVTFLTKFGKAADIVRGLAHPSASVLHEGMILLVQTIFLAFMATAFAIPIAFVLAFPSARNLTRGSALARIGYMVSRTVMNFVRAVELWVHSVAALTKLYSEQIESIDPGPMDAITATGASTLQVLRFGVVPQVIPPFLSFTIYRWDINVRMSTIIGFVGGGGIGYILKPRVDLGEWGEVGTLVLLIAATVWVMDILSAKIRERIV
jgi:phosphonate transport system permease protein